MSRCCSLLSVQCSVSVVPFFVHHSYRSGEAIDAFAAMAVEDDAETWTRLHRRPVYLLLHEYAHIIHTYPENEQTICDSYDLEQAAAALVFAAVSGRIAAAGRREREPQPEPQPRPARWVNQDINTSDQATFHFPNHILPLRTLCLHARVSRHNSFRGCLPRAACQAVFRNAHTCKGTLCRLSSCL